MHAKFYPSTKSREKDESGHCSIYFTKIFTNIKYIQVFFSFNHGDKMVAIFFIFHKLFHKFKKLKMYM